VFAIAGSLLRGSGRGRARQNVYDPANTSTVGGGNCEPHYDRGRHEGKKKRTTQVRTCSTRTETGSPPDGKTSGGEGTNNGEVERGEVGRRSARPEPVGEGRGQRPHQGTQTERRVGTGNELKCGAAGVARLQTTTRSRPSALARYMAASAAAR